MGYEFEMDDMYTLYNPDEPVVTRRRRQGADLQLVEHLVDAALDLRFIAAILNWKLSSSTSTPQNPADKEFLQALGLTYYDDLNHCYMQLRERLRGLCKEVKE